MTNDNEGPQLIVPEPFFSCISCNDYEHSVGCTNEVAKKVRPMQRMQKIGYPLAHDWCPYLNKKED